MSQQIIDQQLLRKQYNNLCTLLARNLGFPKNPKHINFVWEPVAQLLIVSAHKGCKVDAAVTGLTEEELTLAVQLADLVIKAA